MVVAAFARSVAIPAPSVEFTPRQGGGGAAAVATAAAAVTTPITAADSSFHVVDESPSLGFEAMVAASAAATAAAATVPLSYSSSASLGGAASSDYFTYSASASGSRWRQPSSQRTPGEGRPARRHTGDVGDTAAAADDDDSSIEFADNGFCSRQQ